MKKFIFAVKFIAVWIMLLLTFLGLWACLAQPFPFLQIEVVKYFFACLWISYVGTVFAFYGEIVE